MKPFGGFGQSPRFHSEAIPRKRANRPKGDEASDASTQARKENQRRVKGEALGRFPKGETLWWVWAKPNVPMRSSTPASERTARRAMRRAAVAPKPAKKTKRRVKGEALGRFPKGETLWRACVKPGVPKRSKTPAGVMPMDKPMQTTLFFDQITTCAEPSQRLVTAGYMTKNTRNRKNDACASACKRSAARILARLRQPLSQQPFACAPRQPLAINPLCIRAFASLPHACFPPTPALADSRVPKPHNGAPRVGGACCVLTRGML